MWTQKFPRSSRQFQNPLHQNYKHVRTLGNLLELDSAAIHSLIVFVGASTFKTPMPENVTASGGYIRFIKSKTSEVLSAEQVRQITERVQQGRLTPSLKTNREHVQHVKEIVERKRADARPVPVVAPETANIEETCPKCGGNVVQRTIKTGPKAGETFLGCATFPACRYRKMQPPLSVL
jgi:hypothetical protein